MCKLDHNGTIGRLARFAALARRTVQCWTVAYGNLIEHVIARNVLELIVERGWRQSDVAVRMQRIGFDWTPNRVAQTVTLRRPVTLLEVTGLCSLFGVDLERLLSGPSSDPLQLPADNAAGVDTVTLGTVRGQLMRGGEQLDADLPASPLADLLLPEVAHKLDAPVDIVREAAMWLWQTDRLTEVRDAMAGDTAGRSARSVQTSRGHAMRSMLAALRRQIGNDELESSNESTSMELGGKAR